MTILHYILIALEVVLIFNLIIGVHELGHFHAVRWRGLKVERFAIWCGKPIWKKKINGVEYALGTIPFGGYVSLPQMATMELIEGKSGKLEEKVVEPFAERVGGEKGEAQAALETLPNVSPLDKIIVAFAGPLFSFFAGDWLCVCGLGRRQAQQRGGQFHRRWLGGSVRPTTVELSASLLGLSLIHI